MREIGNWARSAALIPGVLGCLTVVSLAQQTGTQKAAKLDAYRLLGRAYYENDQFAEAIEQFRRCLALAPDSAIDHFNAGLSLLRAKKYEESFRMLDKALQLDPGLLGVHYLRGIAYKREGRYEEAVVALERVTAADPNCMAAYYSLGACYKYLEQHKKAIGAFERAVQIDPQHPSSHYQLMTLYRRIGDVENVTRHREAFTRTKDIVDPSEKTSAALERSRYTLIMRAPRGTADLPAKPVDAAHFVDATVAAGLRQREPSAARPSPADHVYEGDGTPKERMAHVASSVGGAVTLGDYDGDADLDIYVAHSQSTSAGAVNRLYRNNGGGYFIDVTEAAGVGDAGEGLDAVFGDYDNDGHNDLYVANNGPNVLYRNRGNGTFEQVSRVARVDEPSFGSTTLFVDYDHDNDLDLFVGNQFPAGALLKSPEATLSTAARCGFNTLLRNNGDGTFADLTDEAGLLVDCAATRDALFADFDLDHDIDLFVVNGNAPSRLFLNARFGRFERGGSFSPAIDTGAQAAAEGDFNGDGKPDLIVAADEGLRLYINSGDAHFEGRLIVPSNAARAKRVTVFDYNNDGWFDLLLVGTDARTLTVLAGAGPGHFEDVSVHVGIAALQYAIADLDVGDVDGDGDQDVVLLTRNRGPVLLRNDNATHAKSLRVRLTGKKVNRCAYGGVVEVAAGGHYRRQTVRRGVVHFGLGQLANVDVVRVTWPNGVAQNVIRPALGKTLTIEEHVRVSASCAFLFAFNGTRYKLVNEILGVGPLGVPIAPGVYHQPDCTELTKIESHQLEAVDGYYDLRLTEDLREIMYADRIDLRVVEHPSELEVIPNEMFTAPPFPEDRLFAIADRLAPLSAVDDRGTDVLPLILERDHRFPTFPLTRYDGLAEPHTLTLDLGDLADAQQIMLFLDGWIYWPNSSTVMAVDQNPRYKIEPLALAVRDPKGRWHTAIESVGLPTSKGLVVPVDLTGRFMCDDYHVRLATNMCVYFDHIFVSTRDQASRCRVTELPVAHAELRYRGFSRMTRGALGFERFDYAEVSPFAPWSSPSGLLTRYGDVTPLLTSVDDRYVIFGPGDELVLRFNAMHLPELPAGWTRDFIFYANGWVKDGDLNTRYSESVDPLPFHGMSGYPYRPSETYPETPQHQRYRRTYNTRMRANPRQPAYGTAWQSTVR